MTRITYEKTFLLIKPDALQRGLVGKIISRIELKGLKLVAMKLLHVTKEQAEKQYECHKGKDFHHSLVEFIISSPSIAMVIEGRNAISICRKMMGKTDPLSAEPGTIRGDFSGDVKHNLIHGSDSKESYLNEVSIYFTEDEIVKYSLALEPWIYYG